jgi:hypothetical protein
MSVPAAVQTYLSVVGQAYKNRDRDPEQLAGAFRLDDIIFASLKTGLSQTNVDLAKLVSQYSQINDADRIHAVIVAFLEYVSQCDVPARFTNSKGLLRGSAGSIDLPSSNHFLVAFERWSQVYSKASLVFQTQDTPYFGHALRFIGTTLVLLAISADNRSGDLGQPCITDTVSKISRTTGIAAVDRSSSPGENTKRSQVLWLANSSFRCYFKLNNIRLCETVLGSVENALSLNRTYATPEQRHVASRSGDANSVGMACYSRADKVTYRYYLGRLRLSQHRIRAAYVELRWAFDNCTNLHMHNKKLILSHLLVTAVILGIYPSAALLRATGLDGPFAGLIRCIQMGDGHGMHAQLDHWRTWHSHHGHYLLLREKLEITAWRNLMRRSFLLARLISGLGHPSAQMPSQSASSGNGPAVKTPPPVLKLTTFLIAARTAWQDDQLDIDDVECVVASLIDQGYVKAYAMHSSGNVVLRRTPDFGFVKISTVY